MKKPDIPQFKGWVKYSAIAVVLIAFFGKRLHLIPATVSLIILLVMLVALYSYKLYFSMRQKCKGYSAFLIISMVVITAICIFIIKLCQDYNIY